MKTQELIIKLAKLADVAQVGCHEIATLGLKITGTWAATLVFEGSVNGSDWDAVTDHLQGVSNTTSNGLFGFDVGPYREFRVRVSLFTSGSPVIALYGKEEVSNMGGGSAVTLINGADTTQGAKADTADTDPTATDTLMAFIKGLVKLTAPASALVRGQIVIAVSGTRIQLPSNALLDGVTIKALNANTNPIMIGGSDVDNKYDGTGKGDILDKGDHNFYKVNNTNVLYVNGTAGDIISYEGV